MLLSAGLIFADTRHWLDPVHEGAGGFVAALYTTTHFPSVGFEWIQDTWGSRQDLLEDNRHLRAKALATAHRLLKLQALEIENLRLKSLLHVSEQVQGSFKMAEIIGVDPDPFHHEVILNLGSAAGIKVGQPILETHGLLGQITSVSPSVSRALLISDANHAIPVQVNRNGVRAIAVGSGHLDKLYLAYLPETADIRVNDVLVSSGLGGRFPFGYPVARVTLVKHNTGAPFAVVEAKPAASLGQVRYVLVVTQQRSIPIPPPPVVLAPAALAPIPIGTAAATTADSLPTAAPLTALPLSVPSRLDIPASTSVTPKMNNLMPTAPPVLVEKPKSALPPKSHVEAKAKLTEVKTPSSAESPVLNHASTPPSSTLEVESD